MASGKSTGMLGVLENLFQSIEKNRKNDIKDAIDNRNFLDLFFLFIVCFLDIIAFILEALVRLPLLFIILPVWNFLGLSKYISRTIDVTKNTDDALENLLILPRQFFMRSGYYIIDFKEDWDLRKKLRRQGKTDDQIKKELRSTRLLREQDRSKHMSQRTTVQEVENLRKNIKKPTQSFLNPNTKNSMGDYVFAALLWLTEKIADFFGNIIIFILTYLNGWISGFISLIIVGICFVFKFLFTILRYLIFVLIEIFRRIPIIGALVPANYGIVRAIKEQSKKDLIEYAKLLQFSRMNNFKNMTSRQRVISDALVQGTTSVFRIYYNILLEILSILTGVVFRVIFILLKYVVETFSQVEFFLFILVIVTGFLTYNSTNIISPKDVSVSSSKLNTWTLNQSTETFFMVISIFLISAMCLVSTFRLLYRRRIGILLDKKNEARYVNEARVQQEEFWYTITKVLIFFCALMALGSLLNIIFGGIDSIKATLPFALLWIGVGELIRDVRTLTIGMRVPVVKHVKWLFIFSIIIASHYISDAKIMTYLQIFIAFIAFFSSISLDKVEEQTSIDKRLLFFYIGIRIALIAVIFIVLGVVFTDEFIRLFVYLKKVFLFLLGVFMISGKQTYPNNPNDIIAQS